MVKQRLLPGLVIGSMAAFAMSSQTGAGAHPQDRTSGGADQPESAYRLIARATQRIERDRHEIRVYRARRSVELANFQELIVARPADRRETLEGLVGKNLALIESLKHADEWDVYTDVIWMSRDTRNMAPLTLPDNVFIVKRVLLSSLKQPVDVRVNGKVHRLKAGETLLVLD